MAMNTLSRREEDTLMKTTKAYALKECDPIVKGASKSALVFPSTIITQHFVRIR